MATRYSGSLKINVLYHGKHGAYRASISRKGKSLWGGWVNPANASRLAVDSSEAYDAIARSALSFADSDNADVSSYADHTGSGWHVRRTEKRPAPRSNGVKARKRPATRSNGKISAAPKSKRGRNLVSHLNKDIRLLSRFYPADRAESLARAKAQLDDLWRLLDVDVMERDDGEWMVLRRTSGGRAIDSELIDDDSEASRVHATAILAERNRGLVRRWSAQMKRVRGGFHDSDFVI